MRQPLAACSALGALLVAAIVQARAASERAEASATVVSAGRLAELLGPLPGAVVTPEGGARIVVSPAAAPAAGTVRAAAESAPPATAGVATTPADGTLAGDIVVAVSAAVPSGAAPAPGDAVNVTVAFN